MRTLILALFGATLLLTRPAALSAQDGPNINPFTEQERQIVIDYLRANAEDLPPGLVRPNTIPRGTFLALNRNSLLPPGISSKPIPPDLLRDLSGRRGLQMLILDDDVIVVDASSQFITEIFRDVF